MTLPCLQKPVSHPVCSILICGLCSAVTLLLSGCYGSNNSGESDEDISEQVLTDPSFEEDSGQWLINDTSEIDQTVSYKGSNSLRLTMDKGLGMNDVNRSPTFKNLDSNTTYTLSFWYRYENCVAVNIEFYVGEVSGELTVNGTESEWQRFETEFFVGPNSTGLFMDILVSRHGTYDNFQEEIHDNNLVWIDNIQMSKR